MTSMNTMPYTTATSSQCRGSDDAFFRMKYSIAAAEKQMKKWSAMPSSTISKPPSRAASPMRQPATPFHGSIHDPPLITRVIDANRKSARPAVKPASNTRFRAWLLVVVSAFIVRLRSVEAERLTPLARWVHTVRRSLRRVPNVDQPSLREDLSHPRESATDVFSIGNEYWRLRIRWASSSPAKVMAAERKDFRPSIDAQRCLIARWSCSTTLLRYRRVRSS